MPRAGLKPYFVHSYLLLVLTKLPFPEQALSRFGAALFSGSIVSARTFSGVDLSRKEY